MGFAYDNAMCFPNTISQIDFSDSQLPDDELAQTIDQYKDQWVNEVGQFQKAEIYRTSGETHRCNLVYCLPDDLKDKFYSKYHKLIGAPGKGKRIW